MARKLYLVEVEVEEAPYMERTKEYKFQRLVWAETPEQAVEKIKALYVSEPHGGTCYSVSAEAFEAIE